MRPRNFSYGTMRTGALFIRLPSGALKNMTYFYKDIPMKEFLAESRLVDLRDDELKELLGFLYHGEKDLKEEKANDPEIAKLKQDLQDYIDRVYTERSKAFKAQLTAARRIAQLRGIAW